MIKDPRTQDLGFVCSGDRICWHRREGDDARMMPHSAHSMAEFVALSAWQNVHHVNLAVFASLLAFLTLQSTSYFCLRKSNLVPAKEAFEPNYSFQSHLADISALVMQYVGEGSGPTALCPHGKPAWKLSLSQS